MLTQDKINELREKLAKLEHEQWEEWSKNIAGNEPISEDRYQRWCKLWKPYSKLTENEKDQDRVYANKILPYIETLLKEQREEYKEAINWAIDEINQDATYLIREGAREGILKLVDYKVNLIKEDK